MIKVKEYKRYEFAVKASIATARNRYDSHALLKNFLQLKRINWFNSAVGLSDVGYKGIHKVNDTRIFILGVRKRGWSRGHQVIL